MIEQLGSQQPLVLIAASAVIAVVAVLVLGKPLLWRLYGFDERIRKLRSQQKSAEVRLGAVAETMAPLLDDFPVTVGKPGTSTVFLGQPIDYVYFDPEEGITFIEIKSGQATLSSKQRALERCVKEGRVHWRAFRV